MKLTPTIEQEWSLFVSGGTSLAFLVFGQRWLGDLSNSLWFLLMFVWLFAVILLSAFAVVRHAESLATKMGEPGGTLILTLAVTGIEVVMISAVMLTGKGNPLLARDAMFAVVMIALNGMIGFSLLLGGLRYHEQTYNLQGANAFLAVIIPLAVLSLVLPNFTVSSPGPTLSARQSIVLTIMSIGLYAVFLAMQISRHRNYFIAPASLEREEASYWHCASGDQDRSAAHLMLLLVAHLLPVVILAGQIAVPITHAIHELHAPPALAGVLVSVLVLSPESMSAVRAAMSNQLQRSVNLLLGSVLATISLTIPAVLTVGFVTGQTIVLGLDPVGMTLLLLTLGLSLLTFASARTNILLGAVHLLIFLAYVMLIFER